MRLEENAQVKLRCGNSNCNTTWVVRSVASPGETPKLALVMETM